MNFLKRATPWMITLLILLGVYVASYVWWYKPNQLTGAITIGSGSGSIHMPLIKTKNTLLDQFYMPLRLCEEERTKQKARKELLRQCQGDWEGFVFTTDLEGFAVPTPLKTSFNNIQFPRVRAMIRGDQFTITWAESMPELVGVTRKIGCKYDAYPRYGVSSNKNYPSTSTIFLTFAEAETKSGIEYLYEQRGLTKYASPPYKRLLVRLSRSKPTSY